MYPRTCKPNIRLFWEAAAQYRPVLSRRLLSHQPYCFGQVSNAAQELDDLNEGNAGRVVVGTLGAMDLGVKLDRLTIGILPIKMKLMLIADSPRWMSIMMGIFFYAMPAGFVLYFVASIIFSFIESASVRRYLYAKGVIDDPRGTAASPVGM